MGHLECDHIKQLIKLTVIALGGFLCTTNTAVAKLRANYFLSSLECILTFFKVNTSGSTSPFQL